jgi:cytochrome c-type biogenesis protein CcmH
MMLWIALITMTVMAVVVVLPPLLVRHREGATASRAEYDLVVYRDQLAEVQRDSERGLLTADQLGAARIEIERRMLDTAQLAEQPPARRMQRLAHVSVALVLVLPLAAISAYLKLGSPGVSDQPLAARLDSGSVSARADAGHEYGAMVAKLVERLKTDPNDVDGWLMLGRSYSFMQRYADAAASFRRAASLSGNPEAMSAAGEAEVMADGGGVSAPARAAFEETLKGDPRNPRARYYLALAEEQGGEAGKALELFEALAKDSPADAPWLPAVDQRMRALAQRLGVAVAAPKPAAPAPAAGYVPMPAGSEALLTMKPDQRDAFIRDRVLSLAARLEQQPQNVEGWLQLARSYKALGEGAKAREAIARAETAAAGTGAAETVHATAQQLGLEAGGETPPPNPLVGTSPDEQVMIRGMVDRLAARLEGAPDDVEGWIRLGRAYGVLGEIAKARDAFARAAARQPDNLELLAELAETTIAAEGGEIVPEAAVVLYRRILAGDPTSGEALWYLGAAAAEANDRDAAVELWGRLLVQLPQGSSEHAAIEARLNELKASP